MAKILNTLCDKFWKADDVLTDLKICKSSLVKYVPSIGRDDEKGVGATGSESTHYVVLKDIFSHIQLKDTDRFVDVGCGKGRVLAFLLSRKFKGKITGIEFNNEVANIAKAWSNRYDNTNIISGNAFDESYNKYNILFLFRPFLPKTFNKFIELIESELDHKITFIYWADQQSVKILNDRKGWKLQYRKKVYKKYGIPVASCPQYYSIWQYEPDNN